MHVGGVKSTLYTRCPIGIICDSEVIARRRCACLWAGLGDNDRKVRLHLRVADANLIIGEEYCEEIADLMRASVKKIVDNAPRLTERDPEACLAVAEGLVMSGVAMSFAKSSRPASGLEHYFSHMWEMMGMERGQKADLHGIQVGVGTRLALGLYDWIRAQTPDRARVDAFMGRPLTGLPWRRWCAASSETLRRRSWPSRRMPGRTTRSTTRSALTRSKNTGRRS